MGCGRWSAFTAASTSASVSARRGIASASTTSEIVFMFSETRSGPGRFRWTRPAGRYLIEPGSQHVARQILVLDHVRQYALHVGRVDRHRLSVHFAGVERQLVEHTLEDRVQAPGADVFGALVDGGGKAGQLGDGIV